MAGLNETPDFCGILICIDSIGRVNLSPVKAKDTVADLIRLLNKSEYSSIRERMQAVILRRQGKTLATIGAALSRSSDWVKRWNDRFKEGGIAGLGSRQPPGATPFLNADAQSQFKERITSIAGNANGLAITRLSDVQVIPKDEFGVEYSRSGAGALMARLGFSCELIVPANLTLFHLPAYSPELNPADLPPKRCTCPGIIS